MYPKAYIEFLAHFQGDRDYFECHEILEDYWKQTDTRNKDSIWVGLILLAVSTYHHRRSNFNGAKRTLEKAIRILSLDACSAKDLGLDKPALYHLFKEQLSTIEKEKPYKSFDLPICDPYLLELCIKTCEEKGFTWGQQSNIANGSLVHRHKLRDRTSIIQERYQSIKMRKGSE